MTDHADRIPSPRRMKRLRRRLEREYGPFDPGGREDGVAALVRTILSQNTSRNNSSAGFARLRRRFRTWDAVADAPTEQVADCIRISGLSNTKAPRIQAILRHLRAERGRITLDFLDDLPAEEAYAYLLGLDGVGPKTALCTLLFAFDRPVFPVDTHIRRIAARMGWIEPTLPLERVHPVLTPRIAPEDRYALHVLLITHGRKVCRARSPRCAWCCLADICPIGQQLASAGSAPAP